MHFNYLESATQREKEKFHMGKTANILQNIEK